MISVAAERVKKAEMEYWRSAVFSQQLTDRVNSSVDIYNDQLKKAKDAYPDIFGDMKTLDKVSPKIKSVKKAWADVDVKLSKLKERMPEPEPQDAKPKKPKPKDNAAVRESGSSMFASVEGTVWVRRWSTGPLIGYTHPKVYEYQLHFHRNGRFEIKDGRGFLTSGLDVDDVQIRDYHVDEGTWKQSGNTVSIEWIEKARRTGSSRDFRRSSKATVSGKILRFRDKVFQKME